MNKTHEQKQTTMLHLHNLVCGL